ncbi:MAG: alpha/beta hydrolase [Fimbriimonadaceae bacterium]|nr:alpha/beta hydrolase [Fimbriimonadaceae bacterium]
MRALTFAGLMMCTALTAQAQGDTGVFDSQGVKIRYFAEGKGEAVVLIHGWMSDSSMWGKDAYGKPKLRPLDGFQAIALDCRGHGQSDKPHDKEKYGAELAADVIRLLDHLKIKKAHLIGYSMGAFIAGKVAAAHPNRVLSVVYGGQAPLLTGESGSREIDVFAKAVEEGKGLGPYLIEVTPHDRPKPTLAQANAMAQVMFASKDVKALAAAGLSFGGLEVRIDDLKKCAAPILFIYGSKESEKLKSRVSALIKQFGNHQVKVVEGGDHITTLANAEFGAAINSFLLANKGR